MSVSRIACSQFSIHNSKAFVAMATGSADVSFSNDLRQNNQRADVTSVSTGFPPRATVKSVGAGHPLMVRMG